MIPVRLRAPLVASAASLLLLLGFPGNQGLWPLRLIADWPGEMGRALGGLLFAGHLGPLALSQASQVQGAGAMPQARALGVVFQLAAGLALFWVAERPRASRTVLIALAAGAGIAAMVPPLSAVTAAELAATLALAILASWRSQAVPRLGLQVLAGAMATSPLTEFPWVAAVVGLGLFVLTRAGADKPVKVRPA